MRSLRRFITRVRQLVSRRPVEITEEMQAHLEMATDDYMSRGWSREAAYRQARLDAGSIDAAAEAYRDQGSFRKMESLLGDLRFAMKALGRNRRFAVGIVLSLALGIGLNTAIFAVTDTVLRRSLPYPDADRLTAIGSVAERLNNESATSWVTFGKDLDAFRSAPMFDGVAIYNTASATLATEHDAEFVVGGSATASLLRVLRTRPLKGRWFLENEGGLPVVISEATWRRRLQSDSNVIGRTIIVNATPRTVIGVLRAGTGLPLGAAYWVPWTDFGGEVIGRLRDGLTLNRATRELNALSPVAAMYRKDRKPYAIVTAPLGERLYGSSKPTLLLLSGAALLFLLIMTANVTNLALARTVERRREFAMRLAIGASARSLASLLVIENLLLAIGGAVAGLLLAIVAARYLVQLAPPSIQIAGEVSIHSIQLLFAGGLALATCLLVSAAPVVAAARSAPSVFGLQGRQGGRGRETTRLRRGLVAAQLALTILLLVGASLMIRTIDRLTRPDHLGFDPNEVVTFTLRPTGYRGPAANALVARVEERIRGISGISLVADGPAPLVAGLGGEGYSDGFNAMFTWRRQGSNDAFQMVWLKEVDPSYKDVYSIRLRSGRWFSPGDRGGSGNVALINETAARLFFGDANPIGRELDKNIVGWGLRAISDSGAPPRTVIGVVANVLQRDLSVAANPEVFVPAGQRPSPGVMLSIRSKLPPAAIINAIRSQLRVIDPQLAPLRLQPMSEVIDASLARHNFVRRLLSLFAGLGLLLSMVGLYAIVSYLVAQRTREIGVRIALGAQTADIARIVLREAGTLVALGILVGIPVAFAGARLLSGFLYGVQPTDAMSFAAAPVVLAVVAIGAAWSPARKAAGIAPVIALQSE